MINLLPKKNKEKIKIEYKARFTYVILLFLLIVIVVSLVFQFLLYSFTSNKKRFLSESSGVYSSKLLGNGKGLSDKIESINKKISILMRKDNSISIYGDIFNTISAKKGDIKIISISYEKNTENAVKVHIVGNSPSRESIVKFVKLLNESGFKNVNSPVSNFIKNKDIEFSIEILL